MVDVTTIYLAAPILLTVIAAVTLNERIGRARWLATLAVCPNALFISMSNFAAFSSQLIALPVPCLEPISVESSAQQLARSHNVALVGARPLAVNLRNALGRAA